MPPPAPHPTAAACHHWRAPVIKRSMGHGYAAVDDELYMHPKTGMYFTDAKN
ncbi:hypothetical protein ACWCQN_30915 [Streptomyces sp. NPDC001984]|uniref:hypothetical protein n=1 Tax=Streptomyces sp. NPDC002619 TaxID=3364655 RepID=UPI0036C258D2